MTLIALLMMAALAGTAVAGPSEDARSAYARGDYTTALQLFRLLAEQGDAHAQVSLGDMCFIGVGVPQDYAEGLKWYRRAAEQGDVNARASLGNMYSEGSGVPQDYVRAHMWFNLQSNDPKRSFGGHGEVDSRYGQTADGDIRSRL